MQLPDPGEGHRGSPGVRVDERPDAHTCSEYAVSGVGSGLLRTVHAEFEAVYQSLPGGFDDVLGDATAPHILLPSVESMRTRVVAAVARCSSRMRTL